MKGAGAGAGAGFFWRALGCSGCLGLGSTVPVPHFPGHPTSICDEGVNEKRNYFSELMDFKILSCL